MNMLLQSGLSNALVATGLAVLVMLLTIRSRRPAWTHALWVLVLLKLVTPPLVWFQAELASVTASQPNAAVALQQKTSGVAGEASMIGMAYAPSEEAELVATAPAPVATTWSWKMIPWLTIFGAVWTAGAVCLLIRYSLQWMAARKWIRQGQRAPAALRTTVSQVASRLELRREPRVVLVRQVVTPSIFVFGKRSTLVLPERLLDQMTGEELETIIAHELVHLRRGDGWVRLLEVFASALFWWHPIVPWVRRKIHLAAEEACDAWVTSILPSATRAYASAMLKTVDFLSGDEQAKPLPLATGMGDVASLSRRMRRISRSPASPSVSPSLSWRGRIATAVIAITLLPLGLLATSESVAQQPPAVPQDPFGGDPLVGEKASRKPQTRTPATKQKTEPPEKQKQVDLKQIDPRGVEAGLRKKLSQKVSIDAEGLPLKDVARELQQAAQVPLFIDTRSLEEIGLTSDIPVTKSFKNVSLRSALRLMLHEFGLTYMIKDEVIQITTLEVAEQNLTIQSYAVPAILQDKIDKIASILTRTVKPNDWEELGGPCSMSIIDNVIVVSGTEEIHGEVERLIKTLKAKVDAGFVPGQKAETNVKAAGPK